MKKKFVFFYAVLFLSSSIIVTAQNKSVSKPPQVEIAGTQILHFQSEVVNQEYDLYINLPRNYSDETKTFPVLFLLDAQWDFPLMQSIYGEQYYDGFVPDIVIVGITWGGKNPNYDLLRRRDFTPSANPATSSSGNAPKFLEFIKNELIPFVESEYRVNDDRALVGSSLGGLFTLYAMFNETDLFKKYILTSPALQWENEILYNYEESFSKNNNSINAKLYLTIGGYENVPMLKRFYDLLKNRSYDNLEIGYNVIEGIGHSGSKADGYTRGLIFAFAKPEISVEENLLLKYCGTYEIMPGVNIKLNIADGKLEALTPDNFKVLLSAKTEKEFYLKGQYLNILFENDTSGSVKGINLETYNGRQFLKKINN